MTVRLTPKIHPDRQRQQAEAEREILELERLKRLISRMRPGAARSESERHFKRLVRLSYDSLMARIRS